MPAHPESVENVIIPDKYMFSWDDEQFLSHQDNDWGILIYGTEENFLNLSRCRTIFIDGTFKTTPHPYYQFLTIHGNYHDSVIPFVMCLLDGKQIGKYHQVLQHVKDKIFQLSGERWSPETVVTDFESSAIETELPNSRRFGCYFHFSKSLWRRIQEIGLTREYRNIPRVKNFLQKLMSILVISHYLL